ncbi:type IV pilin-like G/H family protein [Nodosilinea sp. FACHB-13]|uniref:type IV pilin protein n=1 Tax=Cyanophyceae TaxID=3028117 RepID=UPI0016861D94|nr:type IV pilin-like G/H family protein [Nodosilinea sp. FACHB-13]MBD2106849.1 prepilin-type N-terminal cleavage/methylation domain-containing protein [Nodosilinea sp. FACHB-13]
MVALIRYKFARRPSSSSVQRERGFTLIELMVVVVILGVLATVALPSFLNQAARSKQARALKYVGTINRAQQAFFVEHSRFATSTDELGFARENAPPDYTYTMTAGGTGLEITSTQAIPINPALRGYAGLVFATVDSSGLARLGTAICQGSTAGVPAPTPITVAGQVQIANCTLR